MIVAHVLGLVLAPVLVPSWLIVIGGFLAGLLHPASRVILLLIPLFAGVTSGLTIPLSELAIDIRLLQHWVLLQKSTVDFVAEISRCGESSHVRFEKFEKLALSRLSCDLNGLLDNIVSILVCQVVLKRVSLHNFSDHLAADFGTRALQALFDHV